MFSVLNERTNSVKNSQFDFILDQNVSQRKVFDTTGIADLVKAVVDVSFVLLIYSLGLPCYGLCLWLDRFREDIHNGRL